MEALETNLPAAFIPNSQWEPYKYTNIQVLGKSISNCPHYTIQQALEENTYFSAEAQKAIELITTQKDILPVGSAKFKVHSYPSDIDIFEKIEGCCTINEVRLELVSKIQQIVRDVLDSENILFGDFKAGYDERYDVYFGEEYMGEIIDYNQDIALLEIENLRRQKLLNKEEYEEFKELLPVSMDLETFEELEDYLNSFHTLKWTADEILQGYKDLRGGKRMYLFDALISRSVVKMDLWVPLPYDEITEDCLEDYRAKWDFDQPQRYVEVTNWILIELKDLEGEIQTLSEELSDYAKSLRLDVWHYLSPPEPNILKAAKRFWSYLLFQRKTLLSRDATKSSQGRVYSKVLREQSQNNMASEMNLRDVEDMIVDIAPLFGSYIALLNAVKGDLELIADILDSDVDVEMNFFLQSLDGFQLRLQCYERNNVEKCEFDFAVQRQLIESIEKLKTNLTSKAILELVDDIQDIINVKTQNYLDRINIDITQILFPAMT